MKTILLGGTVLLALAVTLASGSADAANFCIMLYQLDHVEAPNDSTVLFYLRDGEVYANHTIGQCPGLSLDSDFGGMRIEGAQGTGELCSNLVSVRLRRSDLTCLLGAFQKITPAAAAKMH